MKFLAKIIIVLYHECIRKSMQHTYCHIVVVKTSLSGFDVTAAVVVGCEC